MRDKIIITPGEGYSMVKWRWKSLELYSRFSEAGPRREEAVREKVMPGSNDAGFEEWK